MPEFTHEYATTDDPNDSYRLLREEMARLRAEAEFPDDVFDPEAVRATIRGLADRVGGDLVVLVANDFGQPIAFRPEGLDRSRVNDVRESVLAGKYDPDQGDLAAIRRDLLDAHPRIHKVIVAELDGDAGEGEVGEGGEDDRVDGGVRYHLPEGTSEDTNFLTVREMVGLVDYTTNSAQADGLSVTY